MTETAKPKTVFLEYVGRGLGRDPVTQLSPSRHVTWKQGAPRELPADVAERLLRDQPDQFAIVKKPKAAATDADEPAKKSTKKGEG